MAYRRTENVVRRLAARRDAILQAAQEAAAEGGMNAVQIAPVAERAHIAAGTVYRYFPSKNELVAALVTAISEREMGAVRRAADAAPGPLSALAAAIATFAARSLDDRRLAWALIAEPEIGGGDFGALPGEANPAAEGELEDAAVGELDGEPAGGHFDEDSLDVDGLAGIGCARLRQSAQGRREKRNEDLRGGEHGR